MSMFEASDIKSAVLDCESQLTQVRSRLAEIRRLRAEAPKNEEDDSIVLRRRVRTRGFLSSGASDAGSTVSSISSLHGGGSPARRASLSSASHESLRDRIIRTFNLDEKKGMQLMRAEGFGRTPEQTAHFLLNTGGLNRVMIGRALGSFTDARDLEALRIFAEGVDFKGLPYIQSLRKFLSRFKLPGEAQQVDRVLEAFADAYYKANPNDISSATLVHALSFATIMLNTDQHSPSLSKNRLPKMTKLQFIANTKGIPGSTEFTSEFLSSIYDDIVREEIEHQTSKHDDGNLFHDPVKEGWLKKKSPTPPYSWQKRYFILSKNPPNLYYFKAEQHTDPTGYIPLQDVKVSKIDIKQSKKAFELTSMNPSDTMVKSVKYGLNGALELGQHKSFQLKGVDVAQCYDWIQKLNQVISENGST